MPFGRKWLAGILRNDDLSPEEKEKAIMDEHISVTDGLKDERDKYKTEADKVPELQKELDSKNGGDDWKEKYEKEHSEFEAFKKETADNAEAAKVKAAYRKLLSDEGISEKRLDSILKVSDLSKVKLDKDGNIEGVDELKKSINEEWGEFKTTTTQKGARVENPPTAGKSKMTVDEIMAIKDTGERQKAMFENKELFGIN